MTTPQRTYEDLTEAEFSYFDPPQAAATESTGDATPEDSSAIELRQKKVIE